MGYIDSFDDFFAAAQRLMASNPASTRLFQKYRHVDATLVLKVTDDVKCFKYKTSNASDLKNVDKINSWFLSETCGKKLTEEDRHGSAAAPAGHPHAAPHHDIAKGAGSGRAGGGGGFGKARSGASRRKKRREASLKKVGV